MLRRLRISNYALIEHLEIEFKPGFTVITGETGAGKSILLGALGLVLGSRADTTVLHDKNSKCLVEAVFDLENLPLFPQFFRENDLEFDNECILTREIAVSGKSRAFINDTPVNLIVMKALGERLVDIHSQHDALLLGDSAFQLHIIDSLAHNEAAFREYGQAFEKWTQCRLDLQQLKAVANDNQAEIDLIHFQLDELLKCKLQAGEYDELQQKADTLGHAEEIRSGLFAAGELLNRAEQNVVQMLKDSLWQLNKSARYLPEIKQMAVRFESVLIEVKDLVREAETLELKIQFDPAELEKIQARISLLRQLMLKHRVSHPDILIQVEKELAGRLEKIEKKDILIAQLTQNLQQLELKLKEKAVVLTNSRKKMIPEMERSVRLLLIQLGMPNARFEAVLEAADDFLISGADRLQFMFSANKGGRVEELSRVASGGEMSRLMLAIKSLTSGKKMIPTIIFDEIDTGVSGEIAAKVGRIMGSMANQTQLIAISHLPQIAGKASHHLLVYKREDDKRTRSLIIQLNEQQRLDEIARMLSGDVITQSARNAARDLMGGF